MHKLDFPPTAEYTIHGKSEKNSYFTGLTKAGVYKIKVSVLGQYTPTFSRTLFVFFLQDL